MVDVRFELTTNDPWSVDDAICEGISPLGSWQKVNQSPTQNKPYHNCKRDNNDKKNASIYVPSSNYNKTICFLRPPQLECLAYSPRRLK